MKALKQTFLLLLCLSAGQFAFSQNPTVIYVDHNATGSNNGSSWANAYNELSTALQASIPSNGNDIWVATGTYTPGSSRSSTFEVQSGQRIIGGFDGLELTEEEADPEVNPTILSGNIGDPNSSADNAYHVISINSVKDSVVILQGLIVEQGNANGSGNDAYGGGLLSINNTAVDKARYYIRDCIFRNNYGDYGGGMAMIVENFAIDTVNIQQCEFRNNTADYGGALFHLRKTSGKASSSLSNCLFDSNAANVRGGAIRTLNNNGGTYNGTTEYDLLISGSLFIHNRAPLGTVYYSNEETGTAGGTELRIYNCTSYDNEGSRFAWQSANTDVEIENMIFDDSEYVRGPSVGGTDVDYAFCYIPAIPAENHYNSVSDPGFADPTSDDFRLTPCSDLLDVGNNRNLPLNTDMDGRIRNYGAGTDVGAYEFDGSYIAMPPAQTPGSTSNKDYVYEDPATGWTHYLDCSGNNILLSIRTNGLNLNTINLQIHTEADYGSTALNRSTADYYQNGGGWFVANRYWSIVNNVNINGGVEVRYYLGDHELNDLQNALDNAGIPGPNQMEDLNLFVVTQGDALDDNILAQGGLWNQYVYSPVSGGINFSLGEEDGVDYVQFTTTNLNSGGIGFESLFAPLPVEWNDFSVVAHKDQSFLQWSTLSEYTSDYFVIEHALEGRDFIPVGKVQATGWSDDLTYYNWVHELPALDLNYYRIRQVDLDGISSFSPIRSIRLNPAEKKAVQLYPNPTNGQFTLRLSNEYAGENIQLELLDGQQKVWRRQEIRLSSGGGVQLDWPELPSGSYILRLQGTRLRESLPVVWIN